VVREIGTRLALRNRARRVRHGGEPIVLTAFLNYLEEHPATRVLADEFTDVLHHLGCLAAVPIQDEVPA